MGDCGSYFLGFNLASTSLLTNIPQQSSNIELVNNPLNLHILFLIFLLPISDMTIVILKRIYDGNSPFLPDRSHIHHRLLDANFIHRHVVIILASISQFLVALAIIVLSANIFTLSWLLISLLILIYVINYTVNFRDKMEINDK